MSGDIVGSEVDTKGQHIRQGAAFVRQDNAISAVEIATVQLPIGRTNI